MSLVANNSFNSSVEWPNDGLQQHHYILAERFKTRMCYNYIRNGFCPYESRCMFAHGGHEVRTTVQNIACGLFSEEAIKSYQRIMRVAARHVVPYAVIHPAQFTDYDGSYDGYHNTNFLIRGDAKYAAPMETDSNFSTCSSDDGALTSEQDVPSSDTHSPVPSVVGGDEKVIERRNATTTRRGVRWVNATTYCNDPYGRN